jgi:hypothetical protein
MVRAGIIGAVQLYPAENSDVMRARHLPHPASQTQGSSQSLLERSWAHAPMVQFDGTPSTKPVKGSHTAIQTQDTHVTVPAKCKVRESDWPISLRAHPIIEARHAELLHSAHHVLQGITQQLRHVSAPQKDCPRLHSILC